MSLTSALLAPLALLLPAAQVAAPAVVQKEEGGSCSWREPGAANVEPRERPAAEGYLTYFVGQIPNSFVAYSYPPDRAAQVRIEQSVRIRIAPQTRSQAPQSRPDMLVGVPQRAIGTSFDERRIGRCLPISNIAGVQPNGGSDLILYLRDRRIIRAQLERSCRARDFYSGFYISESDGRLCVERDMLHSRSGMNCKVAEIRQLVENGG